MKTLLFAAMLLLLPTVVYSGQANKPVICDAPVKISEILLKYEEVGLVGGKNLSITQQGMVIETFVAVYVNVDQDSFTVVEWIPQYNIACLLANGRQVTFDSNIITPKAAPKPGVEN